MFTNEILIGLIGSVLSVLTYFMGAQRTQRKLQKSLPGPKKVLERMRDLRDKPLGLTKPGTDSEIAEATGTVNPAGPSKILQTQALVELSRVPIRKANFRKVIEGIQAELDAIHRRVYPLAEELSRRPKKD